MEWEGWGSWWRPPEQRLLTLGGEAVLSGEGWYLRAFCPLFRASRRGSLVGIALPCMPGFWHFLQTCIGPLTSSLYLFEIWTPASYGGDSTAFPFRVFISPRTSHSLRLHIFREAEPDGDMGQAHQGILSKTELSGNKAHSLFIPLGLISSCLDHA